MVKVLGKVMQSEMQTYLFNVLKLDHERCSQHKDHQPAFFTNVLAGFVEAPVGVWMIVVAGVKSSCGE